MGVTRFTHEDNIKVSYPSPQALGYSHIWARSWDSEVITNVFEVFDLIGSLFYAPSRSDWPLFQQKHWVISITFSSRYALT